MTTKLLTDPAPEIQRDGWGRPLVIPPGGGVPKPYTRCTTYVGALEDMFKLGQWQQRHVARGIAFNPDLIAAVRDTDEGDRDILNGLVEEAKERSGAGDAARRGTYMHSITEASDRGQDPAEVERPWMSTGDLDPQAYVPDLAAYVRATAELQAVAIEQFCVQDTLKVGGTPDRIVKYQGKRYIADLKTGSIEWGTLKIAAQLAMYARSLPYDVETGERMSPHGAELDRGIVIHLPVGEGACFLYWVDLMMGWNAVITARDVRAARSTGSFKRLTRPLHIHPVAPLSLSDQIRAATTADQVRGLWRDHAAEWTDDLTELARRHIAALAGTTAPNPTAPEGTRA